MSGILSRKINTPPYSSFIIFFHTFDSGIVMKKTRHFHAHVIFLVVTLVMSGCARELIFPFEPLEIEPSGPPLRIRFQLEKGARFDYDFQYQAVMKIQAPYDVRETVVEARATLSLLCVRELKGFGYEIEARVPFFEIVTDGERSGPDDKELFELLDQILLQYKVNHHGRIVERSLEGLRGRRMEPMVERFLNHFVSQLFGRSAIYSRTVRVGDRIVSTEAVDQEMLNGLIEQGLAGSSPKIEAELILLGTKAVEGEGVGVFGLNAVADVVQEGKKEGKKAIFHQGVKVTGEFVIALKGGMPMGGSRLEVQLKGTVLSGQEEAQIDHNYRITWERSQTGE